MVFTDASFGIFMVILFFLYWGVNRNVTARNILLLLASYIFYIWWDWRFLGLIILTSASTWLCALPAAKPRTGRALMIFNIVLNLSILVLFKYFNFFGENLVRLFNLFGLGLDWFTINVLLPVGISFYTFQAISYSVDCYRKMIRPTRNPLTFFTYIAFFPQLVAGPIERASQLIPQLEVRQIFSRPLAVDGMRLILYGLFKKICIADMVAPIINHFYEQDVYTPFIVLKIALLFSIQIYCDFSAYSEIARGSAALFGIRLMANFRFPYFSRNIIEFWSRWHISLMLWFRDYLYIPLGGNRCPKGRQILNIFIVFFLSGLWDGAARNFVVWGVYWGVVYVIGRFVLGLGRVKERIEAVDLWRIILSFGVIAVGFYIFLSRHWGEMFAVVKGIWFVAGFFGLIALLAWQATRRHGWIGKGIILLGVVAWTVSQIYSVRENFWDIFGWQWVVAFCIAAWIEWRNRNEEHPFARVPSKPVARYGLYCLLFLFIVLTDPDPTPFIYFRF